MIVEVDGVADAGLGLEDAPILLRGSRRGHAVTRTRGRGRHDTDADHDADAVAVGADDHDQVHDHEDVNVGFTSKWWTVYLSWAVEPSLRLVTSR